MKYLQRVQPQASDQFINLSSYVEYMPTSHALVTGGIVLYIIGVAYLVLGQVILNDWYFMPALGHLTRRLKLSDDVAGALTTIRIVQID